MPEEAGRARRDDVKQIVTSVLNDYNRADAVTVGPDAVADAVLEALESNGLEVMWREAPDRSE